MSAEACYLKTNEGVSLDRNNCEIGRWCKVEHAKFVLFNR